MKIQVSLTEKERIIHEELVEILSVHRDKRVVVLGTTCTGKTTLRAKIPFARDQDDEIFPLLSSEETEFVCRSPWTKEIGRVMDSLVKERVFSRVGEPVFGTVLIDSDLVILLRISDKLLRERVEKRGASFEDAKLMQQSLEDQVIKSTTPCIVLDVG